MLQKILTILLLISVSRVYSQDERIIISEKKQGKRIVLLAENTTTDTLNIFLMVISEGYRRSADRPVLKNIPPLSKSPMITLIEISNVPSSYSYDLIINDQENDLNFSRVKEEIDIEKVISDKLVIFTKDDCDKCDLLSEKLESKEVNFRNFNIDEDSVLYNQFIAFIQKKQPEKLVIELPVIWNKSYALFGYNDVESLITELVD